MNALSMLYQCPINADTALYADINLSIKNKTVNSDDRGQI
jgi:hypothetical protein